MFIMEEKKHYTQCSSVAHWCAFISFLDNNGALRRWEIRYLGLWLHRQYLLAGSIQWFFGGLSWDLMEKVEYGTYHKSYPVIKKKKRYWLSNSLWKCEMKRKHPHSQCLKLSLTLSLTHTHTHTHTLHYPCLEVCNLPSWSVWLRTVDPIWGKVSHDFRRQMWGTSTFAMISRFSSFSIKPH